MGIQNYGTTVTRHFSDHNLIYVELAANLSRLSKETITARDMRKIRSNPQYFVNSLLNVEWDKLANMVWDVDEMVNFYTSSIIASMDITAPFKDRKIKPKKHCLPKDVQMEKKIRDTLYRELEIAKNEIAEHKRYHGSGQSENSFNVTRYSLQGVCLRAMKKLTRVTNHLSAPTVTMNLKAKIHRKSMRKNIKLTKETNHLVALTATTNLRLKIC